VTEPNNEARAALDAAALARVLDGVDVEAGADAATRDAQARAAADVALISRAFGVIGEALAAPVEGSAAPPAADDAEPDNVVVLPLWRRRPGRTMLAAAASIAVLALGTTVIVTNSGAKPHSADTAAGPAPAAEPQPQLRESQGLYANSAGAAAGDSAAGAPAASPMAPAKAAAPAAKSGTADDGTGESLADAVACARGVFIGKVVSIRPASGDQVSLTLRVSDWISPNPGPAQITYTVGDDDADGSGGRLKKGQQRLFVVPRSTSASVYTFTGPDYTAAKAKIAKAQQQDSGVQC
jgi:hypothetical protein